MQLRTDIVTDLKGNSIKGASVRVLLLDGTLAPIFSNNGGGPGSNPLTTDATGRFSYYAPNGRYQEEISVGGKVLGLNADVLLYDQVDDPSLDDAQAEYAGDGGAALIGYDGGTVQDVLDTAKPMADYTVLRAYTGRATAVRITAMGIAGIFQRDDSDTTSADNGGTAIVDASSRRWKRVFEGDFLDDWFTSLQTAVTAAAGRRLRIRGQWTLSARVNLESNTEIVLMPGALVQTNTANISLFYASGKSNIHFKGEGKLQQTLAGASAFIGGIVFDTCTACSVNDRIEFAGFQWAGVYMVNSNHCRVAGGYFHDWLGSVDNSAAVIIYQDANDNVVENIHAKATGWMGAYVQDPGGAGTYNPQRNKIRNSRIENTTAYGAMLYINHAGNSYNEIAGCTITGVTGTAGAGQYGMGIYAVGGALGGCKILDNTISNCCQNQTAVTNGMGGITITGNAAGYVKPIVSDNTVDGMTQGCGIDVLTMPGGIVIGPNTVNIPSTNTGSGPGGSALLGKALRVINCNDVSIAPGDYVNAGSGAAILLQATDANYSGISLNIGNARAVGSAVVTQCSGSFTINGSISGGTAKSSSDAGNAMQLQGFGGPVSGVTLATNGTGSATSALSASSCTNVRFSNMDVSSTGTYSVTISSSSTGNWDKNSRHTGRFNNSSAGFKTEIYSAGIPTVGVFQISDRAMNSSVTVGAAKAWTRATAGSTHVLGTDWISEGNL